jgi:hypothetical protein
VLSGVAWKVSESTILKSLVVALRDSDLSDPVCCRCEYLTLRRAGISVDSCLLLGHDPQARRIPAAFTDCNIQSTEKAVSEFRAGGTCLTRRNFDPGHGVDQGNKTSLSSLRRVSKICYSLFQERPEPCCNSGSKVRRYLVRC